MYNSQRGDRKFRKLGVTNIVTFLGGGVLMSNKFVTKIPPKKNGYAKNHISA